MYGCTSRILPKEDNMARQGTRTEKKKSRESPSSKRLGERIARIRSIRGWTRRDLLFQLYEVMDKNDPSYESLSEAWLTRLENGRIAKHLPTSTMEAICKALRCGGKERTDLLLEADRNVLTNPSGKPTNVEQVLNFVVYHINKEAHEILATLIAQHGNQELDELELLEITQETLKLLISKHPV